MGSTLMKSLSVPVRHLQVSSRLQEKGFLSSFFERKVEVQQQAHSDKFAKKERISEIQSHNVKPDSIDKYLKAQENLIGFVNANQNVLHGECLGNFSVLIGDQDQFVHIWRYDGGYHAIDENLKFLESSQDYRLIMKDMKPLLRSRESEYFLQFSFWPEEAIISNQVLWWSGEITGPKPSNFEITNTQRHIWAYFHKLESCIMLSIFGAMKVWKPDNKLEKLYGNTHKISGRKLLLEQFLS